MRLYFLSDGQIRAVEILEATADDQAAIAHARRRFLARVRDGFESFELWDHDRFICRYPDDSSPTPPHGRGEASPAPSTKRKKGNAAPASAIAWAVCPSARRQHGHEQHLE